MKMTDREILEKIIQGETEIEGVDLVKPIYAEDNPWWYLARLDEKTRASVYREYYAILRDGYLDYHARSEEPSRSELIQTAKERGPVALNWLMTEMVRHATLISFRVLPKITEDPLGYYWLADFTEAMLKEKPDLSEVRVPTPEDLAWLEEELGSKSLLEQQSWYKELSPTARLRSLVKGANHD